MNPNRRFALAALALMPLATPTFAQSAWPAAKPITWVVPFTPGGSTDVIGRTLANKLQDALKQSVVVQNRPGAGGSVGAAQAARPSDGHLGWSASAHWSSFGSDFSRPSSEWWMRSQP